MDTFLTVLKAIMAFLPGFSTRSYHMAARMVTFVETDVVGNNIRHLAQSFRTLLNEWVIQIEELDVARQFHRAAYRDAYAYCKKQGYMDEDGNILKDEHGEPVLSLDLFNRWAQLKRIKLACENEKVQSMFHYMPGIGFVMKVDEITEDVVHILTGHGIWDVVSTVKKAVYSCQDDEIVDYVVEAVRPIYGQTDSDFSKKSWIDVAYMLRALQMTFAFLKIDWEQYTEHTALFDCTNERIPTLTETDMDLATFDRDDMSFDGRMGRLQAVTRGQESDDEDGRIARLEENLDVHPEGRDAIYSCPVPHRIAGVVMMNHNAWSEVTLMKDVDLHALMQDDFYEDSGEPNKYVQRMKQLAYQLGSRIGIDFVPDNKHKVTNPDRNRWATYTHQNIVRYGAEFKLYMHWAVAEVIEWLPKRLAPTPTGNVNRCWLDKTMTASFSHNKAIFAASRTFGTRVGKAIFIVVWLPGWKDCQVHMLFKTSDWSFALTSACPDHPYIATQIEGDAKDDILALMGIEKRFKFGTMRLKQERTTSLLIRDDEEKVIEENPL